MSSWSLEVRWSSHQVSQSEIYQTPSTKGMALSGPPTTRSGNMLDFRE